MFTVTQPWHKHSDYKKLVKGLEPPPPPSSDGAWELQFCKWWGWNWVKKIEMEDSLVAANGTKPIQSKKPEKKPVKNLCRTLCFKKKKEQQHLQKMYNTPSNSVINDYNRKKMSFQSSNTVSESTVEPALKPKKNVYKTSSNTLESENEINTSHTNNKKKRKQSSSSEEYRCFCSNLKTAGSGDSIEYINIRCCPCSHSTAPAAALLSPKRCTNEKCTQDSPCKCKMMATQTEEKKYRRRRICVVCCCKCGQNIPSRCCSCDANKIEKKESTGRGGKDVCLDKCPYSDKCNKFDASAKPTTEEETTNLYRSCPKRSTKDTAAQFRKNIEPLYITGMPADTMLYFNKPLPKFGAPSRSYSWIHATKSDIWDQFSYLKLNHHITSPVTKRYNLPTITEKSNIWDKLADIRENSKFSSPLSGKTYNISPIKVENLEPKPSMLLNPLNVDEELASLKKIESDVKMDLKSRIMLDAVCDAILNKEPETNSSIFLNEFTDLSTFTQTEHTKDMIVPQFTSPLLNERDLNNAIFDKPMDEHCESKVVHKEENTSHINRFLNNLEPESVPDYSRMCPSSTPTTENCFTSIFNDSLKETKNPLKLVDYTIKNNQHLISMSTPKRRASPSLRNRGSKKVKLQGSPALSSFNKSNVSDIFKKIDEIVMRSKVNNKEIQDVLHNIPNKTFQFFTSWDVSNVIHSNPPVQRLIDMKPSYSSITTVTEEKPDPKNILQYHQDKGTVTRKNAGSRPSLIPKRCSPPNLLKRNVN